MVFDRARFSFGSERRADHLAAADGERPSQGIMNLRRGRMTQAVEDGCRQVVRLDAAFLGLAADLVGCPVDLATPDAAAGQGHRKDIAPVITAAAGVEAWRPAKLRH